MELELGKCSDSTRLGQRVPQSFQEECGYGVNTDPSTSRTTYMMTWQVGFVEQALRGERIH